MSVADLEGVPELTAEDESLYDLSDEELEAQFKANKQATVTDEEEDTEQSEPVVENDSDSLDEDDEDTQSDTTEEDSAEPEDNEESEDSVDTEQSEDDVEPEGKPDEESEPDASEETKESLKPVRANGIDIPVESIDEVYQMASMGANYKQKMADLAPHRRKVNLMVDHNLTEEDLSLLVDIKNNDRDAIAHIIKNSGVDALELEDEAKEYTAKDYSPSEFDLDVKEIVQEISADPEYKMTQRIVDTEWDAKSREMIKANPAIIRALHSDVKNGTYAKVLPEAMRLEMLDVASGKEAKSKLEYSIEATKIYHEKQKVLQETQTAKKQEEAKRVSKKKKAAAATRSRATKEVSKDVDAYDMSEEEFDKWYADKLKSF